MSCSPPSQIVPFTFDTHEVRVIMDEHGQPRFVAADVLAPLDLDSKALEHLDDAEKGVNSIHAPGGVQQITTVSEPGIYSLVLGSRKPEAKRFVRWVTHEVLPAIRKTGAYASAGATQLQPAVLALPSPTEEKVNAHLSIARTLSREPGFDAGMVWARSLQAIHLDTGLNTAEIARALPAATGPVARMNPTEVGAVLGCGARQTNKLLEQLGLQRAIGTNKPKWEITEAGAAYGSMVPFSGENGHTRHRPLWNKSVIPMLRQALCREERKD